MDNTLNLPPKHPSDKTQQKPRIGKTEALIIGLVLAIVGSIVASSFEKGTLTNYAGFGMLLVGIASFVVGACSIFSRSLEDRLRREKPDFCRGKKRLPICISIWAIGAGLILAVIGSMLASTYDRALLMNTVGFGMLLAGIGVSVLGLSSAALGTVRIELNRDQQSKVKAPRTLFVNIVALGLGVVFLVIGTILAGSYAKETLLNDAGFGMLIIGIAVLCLGASGTAVAMLQARFYSADGDTTEPPSRSLFGSIWAIGIGTMLLIIGLIISGNYEKSSIMNYAGFGMLLSGAGVFVYGLFETAKASAMGYLNYRLTRSSSRQSRKLEKSQQSRLAQFRFFWKTMVHTSAVFNLAGVVASVCILFFSLWQLDLIVSGPVWHQNPDGSGWYWPGPGPYANDYFQCFVWKTTIGQAYDTLFMLVFISFIVLFLSAYFWPKQDRNITLKLKGAEMQPTKRSTKPRKRKTKPEPAAQPPSTVSAEDKPVDT
ncbi:MAG: hypothetical protein ACQCN6_01945 [Candidatus Bathyarchaeia archaeon]|jgi:hypothetical protein